MKKKLGNPGNVGQVASKPGRQAVQKTKSLASTLDQKTVGDALRILSSKHFK